MASSVSDEKPVVIHIVVTLCIRSHFSLVAFKIKKLQFHWSLVFWHSFEFNFLGFTEPCESVHLSFVRFEVFSTIFESFFLHQRLSPFAGNPINTYMKSWYTVPQVPEAPFVCFQMFLFTHCIFHFELLVYFKSICSSFMEYGYNKTYLYKSSNYLLLSIPKHLSWHVLTFFPF